MKIIPLTQGMVTIVDDADFDFLIQWKWYAAKNSGLYYAVRGEYVNKKVRCLFMHRLLSGALKGQKTDHKDRNTLNNQRSNLRIANDVQNGANRGIQRNNTSGFKGICKDIHCKNRWVVFAGCKYVGSFRTPEEAARAYDISAEEKFGEFAVTNKKLGLLP